MILAADPQPQQGGGYIIYILMALFFVALYFLFIRPQQKRRRETESMQRGVGPGDEIVTIGGLHGTVVSIDDDVVMLRIAPDVTVRFARGAVGKVVNQVVHTEDEVAEPAAEED